jgi:hypothetical protein
LRQGTGRRAENQQRERDAEETHARDYPPDLVRRAIGQSTL